jgi:hypothetical protein
MRNFGIILADVKAPVNAAAQMLGKMAVNVSADGIPGLVQANRYRGCRLLGVRVTSQ